MKKWIKGLLWTGVGIVILFAVAAILPFVVDLNAAKPQIQAAVQSAVRANLDLSSARLTILTGLGVRLKDVTITNTDAEFRGTKLFQVSSLDFHIDLKPLLSKRFEGYLKIVRPEIVMARKGLKNNFAALPQPAPSTQPEPKVEGEKAPTPEEIAQREKLVEQFKRSILVRSLRIEDATFVIRDISPSNPSGSKPAEPVQIKDLNVVITNIGIDQDIATTIMTVVKVKEPGLDVAGKAAFQVTTRVATEGTKFKSASFKGKLDLDDMALNVKDAFVKKSGIPLNVTFGGLAGANAFTLENLDFHLHTFTLGAQAKIEDFKTLRTTLDLQAKNDQLQSLGDILPQHKNLLMNGSLDLKAGIHGLLSDVGELAANLVLNTKLSGSDLILKIDAPNLKKPDAKIELTSSRLDVGALLKPFMGPAKPAQPTQPAPQATPAPQSQTPPQDFELSPELKALLREARVSVNANLREIIYETVNIKNFVIDAQLQGLTAMLQRFSLDAFDGRVETKDQVNLDTTPISYQGRMDLSHVAVNQITAIVVPEHKDLLVGHANFNLDFKGQGTTVPTLSKTLDARGTFAFLDGEMHTGSVSELMGKELQNFVSTLSVTKAADDLINQVQTALSNPLLKSMGTLKNLDLEAKKKQYASVSNLNVAEQLNVNRSLKDVKGSLVIEKGRIHITSENLQGTGRMKMNASVGIDSTLGGGAVFTASPALREKLVKQTPYAALLFNEKGEFTLPMDLGGTATAPKVSVNFSPLREQFTANARTTVQKELKGELDKATKGGLDKAKDELEKKKAEIQKQVDTKVQEQKKKTEDDAKKKGMEAIKKKIPGF